MSEKRGKETVFKPSTEDISPTMHDPRTQAAFDLQSRTALEDYFNTSPGSATEKLENFAKYVPRQNLARFMARYEIFKLIKDVQGSVVECGVLFGGGLMSFAKLSAILEPYNFQRRIIGFDTFTGFPSVHAADLKGKSERKSAHLKQHGFSADGAYEDILRAIELFDVSRFLNHFPKVAVVRGDFAQTAPQFLVDHPHLVISCLYLDFDIYEPTKLALELFLPRMPKGALLCFDELNEEAFPGETIAVLEACDLKSLRIRRFDFEPRISYAVIGD
jgi:Macrocin-O-methyltransferase (TylF)